MNYHDNDYRSLPFINEANVIRSLRENLTRACEIAKIDQTSVRSVVEFGCGFGRMTKALLEVFPAATVQAVDIDDHLGEVKNIPKVRFLHGSFLDILKSGVIWPADVLTMANMGAQHGFDEKNILLVEKLVKNGKIITEGDNGMLEFKPWFQKRFEVIVGPDQIDPGSSSLLGFRVIQHK